MSLSANALVSLESFKTYAKIQGSSLDSLAEDFINAASSLIEKYCNRKFREQTYTEQLDGTGTFDFLPSHWPITSVTSIHVNSDWEFDADSLIDSSEYVIGKDQEDVGCYICRLNRTWPRGRMNVQIVYKAGYEELTDVPSDLKLACMRTAAYYFTQEQNQDFNVKNRQKGDETIDLIEGIPQSAIVLIKGYKRLEMRGPSNSPGNV